MLTVGNKPNSKTYSFHFK